MKIWILSSYVGADTSTFLSNLPALRSAGSRVSGLLVAAMTIMLVDWSNPSISVRIWLRVCSCSWCPQVYQDHLLFPIASISSIKIIALPAAFACSKSFLTFAAPSPTSISINSDPAVEKNATSASPATALARSVFPPPGAP